MEKYVIIWNAGYGDSAEIIECASKDDALEEAYQMWKEEAEGQAEYSAVPFSKEIAEEHGLDREENNP